MNTTSERLEAARRALARQQVRRAEHLLRGVLEEDSQHLEALRLLGKLMLSGGKAQRAVELLERALALRPRDFNLLTSTGSAYFALGRYEDAVQRYRLALRVRGRDGLVHFHLGGVLRALGKLNEACHSYQRAIYLRPTFLPARLRLAELLVEARAYNAAAVAYKAASELAPRRADIHVDLGNALRECGNDPAAKECYEAALELNPESISALNNLGNLLRDHGQFAAALELADRAIVAAPAHPVLHNARGLAQARCGRPEEAAKSFARALELKPDYGNAHFNLGRLCQEVGNLAAAEEHYRQTLAVQPARAEAHHRLAKLWLLNGNYEQGWPEYAFRPLGSTAGKSTASSALRWTGEPLSGRSVLVEADEPTAELLYLVRFVRLLQARGARVAVRCRTAHVKLLQGCDGVDAVVPVTDDAPPAHDFVCDLRGVPALLGGRPESVPASPCLKPSGEAASRWRSRLAGLPGMRVGVAWRGPKLAMLPGALTMPESVQAQLGSVPNVSLIDLQSSAAAQRPAGLGGALSLCDAAEKGALAWEELAAAISCLDLVIAMEGPIANLAASLGAPTWVLVDDNPEWVWAAAGDHSPWYPTARIFRAAADGGEFDGVAAALGQLAQVSEA